MPEAKKKDDEVVCEFFGIKITTKNPNVARILTSDVAVLANLDVREVKTFIMSEDNPDDESTDYPEEEQEEEQEQE